MIRYGIGDYAEVGEPCPCGRGLPALKRVQGRSRNMLTLPSGEQRWPHFRARRVAKLAPIRQIQCVQKSLEHIKVRLVTERQLTFEEEEKAREFTLSRLGYPSKLTFTYHDEIPRSASGKYEEFMSEVGT